MPLGNGRLGLAVWSADGLTLQLNRADTLPGRLSPGQVVLPGLTSLDSAKDYAGRVNLYDGEFTARGNGMRVTVYVHPATDVAVIEVSGTDPKTSQTVLLRLWPPRHPRVQIQSGMAILSETWTDSTAAGATGRTFGSLAAVRVIGQNVQVSSDDPLTARFTFLPDNNGSFRVLIGAPHWTGGDAFPAAQTLLTAAERIPAAAHRLWWNSFWQRAGLMEMASEDGSAEYLENLRNIYLFTAAAENGGAMPGSQAGIADLFSSARDFHQWDPAAYWHFNLRMQVAANLGAGLFDWNGPYFRLYRDNLLNIERWTESRMSGLPGACVPETMRFNGQGFENEAWISFAGLNCDANSKPYYNARTLSTGAEVSLWIWRQYLATDDGEFLAANYPMIAAAARFLLAYSRVESDGRRHTFPSNAHENQWDVHDPTTDICAMRALFPVLIEAARTLGRDADLARKARAALAQIPELPRTDLRVLKQQLMPEADVSGQDAIGQSYDQNAPIHNTENVGLEPVWPYGLIGDRGPLHELGVRTYQARPNKMQNDWSFDPLQAGRLGMAGEVRATLIGLTKKYQAYPSGLASFVGPEFYVEQIAVVAAALQEALVQDYDGLLRIAPAWPKEWDVEGTVFVQHKSKVSVKVHHGLLGPVAFDAGFTGNVRFRNPWPGEPMSVTEGGHYLQTKATGDVMELAVERGKRYVLTSNSGQAFPVAPAKQRQGSTGPRSLGQRSIGLGQGAG